jgi:ribonuclease HI
VPQAALKKYPGWIPTICLSCKSPPRGRGDSVTADVRMNDRPAMPAPPADPDMILAETSAKHSNGPFDGVFTDGACSGNPGPGGWAAVHVHQGKVISRVFGHEDQTTNNRMELTALIAGFRMLDGETPVTIWSDSELCVKTINEWAQKWEQRGWRRKGGPIKNLDLVRELFELARSRPNASLRWVKAHNGSLWNEYVDALATALIRGSDRS